MRKEQDLYQPLNDSFPQTQQQIVNAQAIP